MLITATVFSLSKWQAADSQVVSQVTLCVMTLPFGDRREAKVEKSAVLHVYLGLNNANKHHRPLNID